MKLPVELLILEVVLLLPPTQFPIRLKSHSLNKNPLHLLHLFHHKLALDLYLEPSYMQVSCLYIRNKKKFIKKKFIDNHFEFLSED